jgi:hypothetical protein
LLCICHLEASNKCEHACMKSWGQKRLLWPDRFTRFVAFWTCRSSQTAIIIIGENYQKIPDKIISYLLTPITIKNHKSSTILIFH